MEPQVSELIEAVSAALKAYHQPASQINPFSNLQIFQQICFDESRSPHEATNKIVVDLLEALDTHHPEASALLRRRFLDEEKMRLIANSLNMSPATAYRKQDEAIALAARLLQVWEREARQAQQALLEKRLERPTYSHLIGFEGHKEALVSTLSNPDSPWLVSIEGLGGIGKTSLAHDVARQLIRRRLFEDVGWISARQHIFKSSGRTQAIGQPVLTIDQLVDQLIGQLWPDHLRPETGSTPEAQHLLKTRLKQRRHLIVIDNLETLADVETLLPALRAWANPSKFLLTSRQSFYHEPHLYHYPLPELSQTETIRLIRAEIESHNLSHLQAARDEELGEIYRIVGGNPLAIRLVIGQTHVFTLAVILDDLQQARSRSVDELYTFIYRRAWDALDEPTRDLFLVMPLLTDSGEQLDDLVELCELAPATVHTSLKHLVDLNLVNASGNHKERYYNIHNLTRTFLEEQVLKWKQA